MMTSKTSLGLTNVHPSWRPCLEEALEQIDPHYLEKLQTKQSWLPGPDKIFSAFSLPMNQVNYLLFGESPYPRADSANGYAFWDAAVKELWSPEGMSKKVNRATSLRNLIKMLLVAEGLLKPNQTGQEEIAKLDKSALIQSNSELFNQLLSHGFLLLNASLVLSEGQVKKEAQAWYPFVKAIIASLLNARPEVKLILFGSIAKVIEKLLPPTLHTPPLIVEHPYNIGFITNPEVLDFFRPLHLLTKS